MILCGVEPSTAETPTSLYLAMQHGLKAANLPFPETSNVGNAVALVPHRKKVFRPHHHQSRPAVRDHNVARAPATRASRTCRMEVHEAESMMRQAGIRWLLSTTTKSIEEIPPPPSSRKSGERLTY